MFDVLSAIAKLEPSKLTDQLEGLGGDIDLEKLELRHGPYTLNILPFVTVGARITRTIEGASTVTIPLRDRDQTLLNSGMLAADVDINIDGLWFRLVKVSGDVATGDMTLTFEDREVALLRTYNGFTKGKQVNNKVPATNARSRAAYARTLVAEVDEIKIPFFSPILDTPEPVTSKAAQQSQKVKDAKRASGFAPGAKLTVKGARADTDQIKIAETILDTGVSLKASRKVLLASMMVAIQESTMRNLLEGKPGDYNYISDKPGDNPVGVFQQRKTMGWPASRDVAKDAHEFFVRAIAGEKKFPSQDAALLGELVQASGQPDAYRRWLTEADRWVKAYGISSDIDAETMAAQGSSAYGLPDTTNQFTRGTPVTEHGRSIWKRENSWETLQRLASEVRWRCYVVSGTVYFISEPDLFKSRPRMTIRPDSDGILGIQHDYDTGKVNGQITIRCRIGRWAAPPGSTVELEAVGPLTGRWIVTSTSRDIFSADGEITLKKPSPVLPEAKAPEHKQDDSLKIEWPTAAQKTAKAKAVSDDNRDTAQKLAKRLLQYMDTGDYRADNGQQRAQWQKVAAGQKLRNQCGGDVTIDRRVPLALLSLLESGFQIGTFAICEDHHCNDGQHPKGQAVDISSLGKPGVGWFPLNTPSVVGTALVKDAMRLLAKSGHVWDLICTGLGQSQADVQALQLDNGQQRGGPWGGDDHKTHIHLGVAPSTAGSSE